MVKTDGKPTIAWADPKQPAACPLPTTGRDRVREVRVAPNRATTENIAALRERYPNADIVIRRAA